MIEVHAVAASLLILDKLEVVSMQTERTENAVSQAFQLAHHLSHLVLFGPVQFGAYFADRLLHCFPVQRREIGHTPEISVI